MTARFDVTPKITEMNRIVRTGKYEAEVTSNIEKKLCSRYFTIEAIGPLATAELYLFSSPLRNRRFSDICQHFSDCQFSYNQQPICTILGEITDADEFLDEYDGHPDPD